MNVSLMNFLKCVDCSSSKLELRSINEDESKKIVDGYIRCIKCGSVFPILQGIPIIFNSHVINEFLSPREAEDIAKLKIPLKRNQV